jgi:hypothetical protein
VGDAEHLLTTCRDGGEERIRGVDQVADHRRGDRPVPGDLTHLISGVVTHHVATEQHREVDPDQQLHVRM